MKQSANYQKYQNSTLTQIIFIISLLFLSPILSAQSIQNVMITSHSNPNEPSIIVNKTNTNNLIVANNNQYYYVSNDGGLTWTEKIISSIYGYYGDPSLNSDTSGNLYLFHLTYPNTGSWLDRISCQKSTDNGQHFTLETYTGLNPPKDQDKEWSAIDSSGNIYLTWTQFDQYGSTNPNDHSNILFSKSTDGGQTWSNPIQINEISGDCIDSDNTVEGAVPAVGPNGEIYVSWVGPAGLVFDKSTDGGQTWLAHDIIINDMQNSGGWDYNIPGLDRCNGLPITQCDTSNGPHRGTIYVNWSDQRNGTDNTDIFLAKSTDGGLTWSAPIKVNDDTGHKHQFLTWMSVDPSTGYLYFVFYDRRHYNDNNTDVYMAVSRDGGTSFTNVKISNSPFIPNASHFFGDYTNISAYNGMIRPVWTRLNNNSQSLWTAIVSDNDLVKTPEFESPVLQPVLYPVPVTDELQFKYRLKKSSKISINLLDTKGRILRHLIRNQWRAQGKNREHFKIKSLPKGIYFVQILTKDSVKTLKIIKK